MYRQRGSAVNGAGFGDDCVASVRGRRESESSAGAGVAPWSGSLGPGSGRATLTHGHIIETLVSRPRCFALAPDRLSALRRVATVESICSSMRIEGSKLSDRDVDRLLSNLQIKSVATRDEQEVAGYAGVMELVFSSWRNIPLTENHVRQLR